MSKHKYEPIPAHKVHPKARFDVPAFHAGQIVEIAFGGFDRCEHGNGDLYKRITDYSLIPGDPERVKYFKLVKEKEVE